jgi:hypothetical protein
LAGGRVSVHAGTGRSAGGPLYPLMPWRTAALKGQHIPAQGSALGKRSPPCPASWRGATYGWLWSRPVGSRSVHAGTGPVCGEALVHRGCGSPPGKPHCRRREAGSPASPIPGYVPIGRSLIFTLRQSTSTCRHPICLYGGHCTCPTRIRAARPQRNATGTLCAATGPALCPRHPWPARRTGGGKGLTERRCIHDRTEERHHGLPDMREGLRSVLQSNAPDKGAPLRVFRLVVCAVLNDLIERPPGRPGQVQQPPADRSRRVRCRSPAHSPASRYGRMTRATRQTRANS